MSMPAQACQSIEHSPSRFSPHPSRPCSTFLKTSAPTAVPMALACQPTGLVVRETKASAEQLLSSKNKNISGD